MSTVTRIYASAFLLNGDGTLGQSSGRWFKPQMTIGETESFTSKIRLSGEPDCQWCENVIIFANIFNEDTGKVEEVPHMRWNSFEDFKQEYLLNKNIPGCRFIEDEYTKNNYKYLLDYADI